MPNTNVELIEEFIAELIISNEKTSMQVAIASTVERFANSPAIDATFAFVSMASTLEQPIFKYTDNDNKLAMEMYRAIAMFTADIYAVEKLSGPSPTCSQISDFWVETKEAFFTRVKPQPDK